MAELIDIYTDDGKFVGVSDRKVAHRFALRHKTVHCWLTRGNNIIFQKRSLNLNDNPGKLYTTASGHLAAGETVIEAFRRETAEEFGLEVAHPVWLYEGKWDGDFKCVDGTDFLDRVFWTCFYAEIDVSLDALKPQADELDGLVELDMNACLDLFAEKIDSIPAEGYLLDNGEFKLKEITVTREDFLCNPPDTLMSKFGKVIEWVLEHKA